jgi:hypothetical protein
MPIARTYVTMLKTGRIPPFMPIYMKAARQNYDVSARFFGQLVWHTIMSRDETWGFGRYEVDGRDIGSLTYFRVAT